MEMERRRTLYRYVDWNLKQIKWWGLMLRRTLYRYVDWNGIIGWCLAFSLVVPYIGTWIETNTILWGLTTLTVVPYIGTWIETGKIWDLSWERPCRTLYRYVDWNINVHFTPSEMYGRTLYRYVDWNRIGRRIKRYQLGRTLYRYVDWNPEFVFTEPDGYCRTLYRYVDWNCW